VESVRKKRRRIENRDATYLRFSSSEKGSSRIAPSKGKDINTVSIVNEAFEERGTNWEATVTA